MKVFLICLFITVGLCYIANVHPMPTIQVAAPPQIAVAQPTPIKAKRIDYAKLALFIEKHEGFRAKPYRDRVGVLTVGFGTQSNHPMTKQQARIAMRKRIQQDYDVLSKYVSHDTALVLCSFSYNVGLSHAVKLAKSRNLSRMKYYCNAGGKKLAGLKTRRAQELALLK